MHSTSSSRSAAVLQTLSTVSQAVSQADTHADTTGASSVPNLRDALTAALVTTGAQPDRVVNDMVDDLIRGLRGAELDLTTFTGERAARLIGMSPSGWTALEREAKSSNKHSIRTVVLSSDLSNGRMVGSLMLLPGLERLEVSATPSSGALGFAICPVQEVRGDFNYSSKARLAPRQ